MKLALVTIPLALLAATGVAQAPERADVLEAAAGQTIYTRYCAACHGRDGKGDGPVASGLVKKPIDLTALQAMSGGRFPYEKIARAIDGRDTPRAHGTPDMPVWGEVFGKTSGTDAPTVADAVKRITHYVWSIQGK
jgi:mono/diheme cytochrome c family protein